MKTLSITITDRNWHNLTDLDVDNELEQGSLYLLQINTGKLYVAPSDTKPKKGIIGILAAPNDAVKIEYRENLTWVRVIPKNAIVTVVEVLQ